MSSSTPSSTSNVLDVSSVTGPTLLAHLFNWGLFGILTAQLHAYYIGFPNDPYKIKCMVYYVYTLEVIQLVTSTYDAYRLLANGWGQVEALEDIGLIWFCVPVMDGISEWTLAYSSGSVEMFYAWRVYMLSRNRWLVGFIVVLGLFQASYSIYDGICIAAVKVSADKASASQPTLITSSVQLACDATITGSMIYYLLKAKHSMIHKRMSSLLSRVIALTVETSLICAVCIAATLISFLALPGQGAWYAIPSIIISKLYSISLLALLNSRSYIAGGRDQRDVEETPSDIDVYSSPLQAAHHPEAVLDLSLHIATQLHTRSTFASNLPSTTERGRTISDKLDPTCIDRTGSRVSQASASYSESSNSSSVGL
ncbi:hypothetical protein EIP91_003392 [Steccherinum ochraceum]|uniref:DUF6534 domain-containing protein n=1 Tax=Steccherinum ochraceum TaxID=92696 RepID=A0A4R0RJ37_9APHY|nr:hypothetical protein EIP91_003392 [Steccherinum ochraceum]